MRERSRSRLAHVVAFLLLSTGSKVMGQQVTDVTIITPAPATFNIQSPFRTNSPILAIDFTHNGASGNYFISTMGADVEGAIFLPQPTDTAGKVLAGFVPGNAGQPKAPNQINLVLLQTRLNVVARTTTPVVVQFDDIPPDMLGTLRATVNGFRQLSLTAPAFDPNFPGRRRLALPAAGAPPIRISGQGGTPVLRLEGTVSDNFTANNDVQVQASTALSPTPINGTVTNGNFVIEIPALPPAAELPDGTYDVEIRATDRLNDPSTRTGEAAVDFGNTSGPIVVQVVVDRTPPRVERVEVIHFVGGREITEPAGPDVFVGDRGPTGDGVTPRIRVTVSEPLTDPTGQSAAAPRLQIQQNLRSQSGGNGTFTAGGTQDAALINADPSRTVFTYEYPVISAENRNGPAQLFVTGRASTGSLVGFGTDQAGNPISCEPTAGTTAPATCTDPGARFLFSDPLFNPPLVNPAFFVDTVSPDLRREGGDGMAISNQALSNPARNSVVSLRDFPRTITIQVRDYNSTSRNAANPFNTDEASGIDFGRTAPLGSLPGGQNETTPAMNVVITAVRDNGTPIDIAAAGFVNGQLAGVVGAGPPTVLTFTPDPLFFAALARSQTDPDHPLDGLYTMTVDLIDRVNNRSRQTLQFRVDTRPIREETLQVSFTTQDGQTRRLGRTGTCVPQPGIGQMNDTFPVISVTSTETDFSTTDTRVSVIAFINGIDSQGYDTISTSTPDLTSRSLTVTVTGIQKLTQSPDIFPIPKNPPPPAPGVDPGEFDPRAYLVDGPYTIRIEASDASGNRGVQTTDGRVVPFIDFDTSLDTRQPFTERTFPADGTAINAPLRFVDSVIVDPPARRIPDAEVDRDFANPLNVTAFRWVPGCGIDITRSRMVWRLETPYQPGRVDRDLIVGGAQFGQLRGTLRFIHIPNNNNPNFPDFNPNDDRFRLLLELTDRNQNVRTLPTDGRMDGIYSITVNPVDGAGNSFLGALGDPNVASARRGPYFGLAPGTGTTQTADIQRFFFLYDTVAPKLEVDNFPDGVLIGGFNFHRGPAVAARSATIASGQHRQSVGLGPNFPRRTFRITGRVTDLSAQGTAFGSAGTNLTGGAGMSHVEYELRLVDRNLNLVQPTPPTQPPPDPGTGDPPLFQRNPIIVLKRGQLQSFGPETDPASIDPIPTTTNPWSGDESQTPFDTLTRPRHTFVIEDTLPPSNELIQPRTDPPGDFYLFVIRAVDRAGNVIELARRVTLNVDDLGPPTLISPPDEAFVNRALVEFRWAPATNVTTYVLTVSDPNSNVVTRTITGTAALLSFAKEGRHIWNVASTDALGNIGPGSANRSFIIDRTPPRVANVIVANNVEPSRRSGVLTLGDVLFTLEFSENVDPRRPPGLTFKPPSIPAQPVTTEFFEGKVWRGRGKVPTAARPETWDGITTIQVTSVFDLAGNALVRQPEHTYEIDTGPDYDTRFFFNPTDPKEIILVMVATEELRFAPRVTEITGAAQISNRADPFRSNPRAFYTSLRLDTVVRATEVQLSISGEDLEGNTSRRVKTFTVTPIGVQTGGRVASADGRLSIDVPPGAVEAQTAMFVFPPAGAADPSVGAETRHTLSASWGSARAAQALAGAPGAGSARDRAAAGGEILWIEELYELAPGHLTFRRPGVLTLAPAPVVLPDGVLPSQVGVYGLDGSRWVHLAGLQADGTWRGSIHRATTLRLGADRTAPVVELPFDEGSELDQADAPLLARVRDGGAGVGRDRLRVTVDGRPLSFEYDEAAGEVRFALPADTGAGRHRIEIAATDRAGNVARSRQAQVIVPGSFGILSAIPWPNPARFTSTIRFVLTQPARTSGIEVDLFDAVGRRIRRITDQGPFMMDHDVVWDLTTRDGSNVGTGVYFFKARADSVSGEKVRSRGKIAVVR